jgi:hypothetical protein
MIQRSNGFMSAVFLYFSMPSVSFPVACAANMFILRNPCQFGFAHADPAVTAEKVIDSYLARNNDNPGIARFVEIVGSHLPSHDQIMGRVKIFHNGTGVPLPWAKWAITLVLTCDHPAGASIDWRRAGPTSAVWPPNFVVSDPAWAAGPHQVRLPWQA